MKCWVLVIRRFRSRCFIYMIIFLCVFYLCKVYHNRRSFSIRSMFYNFPYLDGHSLFFRRTFGNYNQFTPGAFLQQLKPSNESFCNFRLGFPDFFDLSDSEINFSPELGEKGSYRVIYNVLKGSWTRNTSNSVTYCSHLTPEFLYYLVEIVVRWEGPISIAAFVPSYDASTILCLVQKLCLCVPEMSKVSLHFVFPIEYPPDHLSCSPSFYIPDGCSIPAVISSRRLKTFRNQEELIYPVNVARNVARTSASTKFVLVSDIELIPSSHLVSRFEKMLLRFNLRSDGKNTLKNFVYVIPVFEVEHYISKIPEKKSELLYLYSLNKAIYFHRWICLHCQRFPGLQRWIHHSNSASDNSVQPMLVVKREFPYHRWEPIYIGTNEEPLYSELLSWEGKQDKMAQMHEMCLLGYRFVILDGAFLVHAPGVKRHPGPRSEVQTAHHFNNMRHYDEIMRMVTERLGSKQGCKIH